MELSEHEKQRYTRQIMLPGWGGETQVKLKTARVLVVGSGALGCAVLQNLARTGIGTLGIADDDVVSLSNLQRQVLFSDADIGAIKSRRAAELIACINPNVRTEVFSVRVFPGNILDLIASYDVVVDGTDNFSSKYLLNDACVLLDKPLVSGSIEGFEGQVSVYNFKGGPTYRCIFPESPEPSQAMDCDSIGVTTTLPLLVGNLQASEVVKVITGLGEVFSGKLIIMNVLNNSFNTFSFALEALNRDKDLLRAKYNFDPENFPPSVEAVDANTVLKLKEPLMIDVRDEHEHTAATEHGGLNIPLYEVEDRMGEIPVDRIIVTYCNSGLKAKQAGLLISKMQKRKVHYFDGRLS